MKKPQLNPKASRSVVQSQPSVKRRRRSGKVASQVPKHWNWHYQVLSHLRDRLMEASNEAKREAAEPVERHSMHQADSATDEFDHDLVLSRLSTEQDALFEVEAAMERIAHGTYGVCEQSGKRIPMNRLKAIPWTRFREEVEARLEDVGVIRRAHLGMLRSLRDEPVAAVTDNEPTVDEPEPVPPSGKVIEPPIEES